MNTPQGTPALRTSLIAGAWIVAALAASYVLIAHRVHALEWLPFVLVLACPLLHIFMHGGHGDHGHRGDHGQPGLKD